MDNEPQAIEGYGCQCGYKTDDVKTFRTHLLKNRTEPGQHKSIGRVNLMSGEIILPPWEERSSEEKLSSSIGLKKDGPPNPQGKTQAVTAVKNTDNLSEASEIRFVPRVYTATLSPILQTAFVAAQRVWGWRNDMPFINFLDTCIYNFFKEHGVTLAAYVVEKPPDNGGTVNPEIHGSPEDNGPENYSPVPPDEPEPESAKEELVPVALFKEPDKTVVTATKEIVIDTEPIKRPQTTIIPEETVIEELQPSDIKDVRLNRINKAKPPRFGKSLE